MKSVSVSDLKRWGLLVLALPWLAACGSVAPGMQFGNANASSTGTEQADASAVPTTIKQITPQVVKAEQESRLKEKAQDISQLVGKAAPYGIEPGDILSITVWDHPELAGSVAGNAMAVAGGDPNVATTPGAFTVDHDGMLEFPYAGNMKVAGLTEEQARKLLISRLAKYINKPKVTLRVQQYRSKRIYVDGQVKTPGLQAINDIPMTLVEAINRAGGFLPTADQSQIALTRGESTYRINLPDLVQKGVNPASIMLRNGDVVRVKSREESKVFVAGEVVQPRALPMYNGRLTLNDALGESGGINPTTGDSRQIYVVRKSSSNPVVYQLDAQAPGALALAEGFELHPKDVVYVAATPLANWHRTISQILPGALSSAVGSVAPYRTGAP